MSAAAPARVVAAGVGLVSLAAALAAPESAMAAEPAVVPLGRAIFFAPSLSDGRHELRELPRACPRLLGRSRPTARSGA